MSENNNYDQFRSFWRRISTKPIKISNDGIEIDQNDQDQTKNK